MKKFSSVVLAVALMCTAQVAIAKDVPEGAKYHVTCSSGGYSSYDEYASRVDIDGSTAVVVHLLDGGKDILVNRQCTVNLLRAK